MSTFSGLSAISGEDSLPSLDSERLHVLRPRLPAPPLLSASMMNSAAKIQEQVCTNLPPPYYLPSAPTVSHLVLKKPLSRRREIETLSSQLQEESRLLYTEPEPYTEMSYSAAGDKRARAEFGVSHSDAASLALGVNHSNAGAGHSNAACLALERCLLHEALEEERARNEQSVRELQMRLDFERRSKDEAYAAFIEAHHQLSSTKLQSEEGVERDRTVRSICDVSESAERQRDALKAWESARWSEKVRYIRDELTNAQSDMRRFESGLLAAQESCKVGEERARAEAREREREALREQEMEAEARIRAGEEVQTKLRGDVSRLEDESKQHRQNCLSSLFMAAKRLMHVTNVYARRRKVGWVRCALAGWMQVTLCASVDLHTAA
jgi:hypothetical protein